MAFNPAIHIPDLVGKVIFVTGGTAGLGKQSIVALARKNPTHIYFSGRDADRAAALIAEVTADVPSAQLTFVKCNMSSLANVAEAAKEVVSKTERLDIMMCNAGVLAPPALTEDGYEIQFGINHLAHALLVKLLLPTLLRTPDARVVVMTSQAFSGAPSGGIQFDKLRTTQSGFPASIFRYPQSKLANLLYAAELARRYPQITAVSVHPGVANTAMFLDAPWVEKLIIKSIQMWKGEPIVSPEAGAFTQLWAATVAKSELVNGEFYVPVGVLGKHSELSVDKELAAKLWDWTEKELEGYAVLD
ncbi:oxidoreductase [Mycena latifolia]|nr:oxidoreductase [Mycena latifolia]